MMDLGLRGKVALVSGGSRGIGLATAIELAREGADVCVVARDRARLSEAVTRLTSMGVRAAAVVADLSNEGGCAAAVAGCEEALGGVDILINCAGAARQLPVLDLPVPLIEEALDLKLFGYLRLSQLVAPGMRARGWGRIVNIAGGAGTSPTAGNLPTSLANIGVLNLTRALSDALSGDGVLVNVICPGVTDTDRARDLQAAAASARGIDVETAIREAGARLPAGRIAHPEEIARVATFLASEACSYVFASAVYMDGGARRATP
jgi:NAD(P)-dependent dehydrogenase (short-subunit alcohol dehydrogenase family)